MSRLFIEIINNAIAASWLILAIIFLRLILKRAPKWIPCMLWSLVFFRLVFPISIDSVLSLVPSDKTVPIDIEYAAKPNIDSGIAVINNIVNPVIENNFTPDTGAGVNPMQIWMLTGSAIWICGIAVMFIYAFVSFTVIRKKVMYSVRISKNIYACDGISTPFILGIINPGVYLPSGMNSRTMECVLVHENTHIGRGDHLWKPIGFLILSVYWFNPLCWVAYSLFCRDIEYACDEKAIRNKDKEWKAEYCQALLDCSVNRKRIAACPVAFGEVGVKERVKSVFKYKEPKFVVVLVSVIICIIVAVCFLTNPKEEELHNGTDLQSADVPEQVMDFAIQWVEEKNYTDSRITSLKHVYTYRDFEGMTLQIYQINYEFLAENPKEIILAGGMSMDDEGWVVPDYPNSHYLVFKQEGEQFSYITHMFENDCFPGDELFTEDLTNNIKNLENFSGEENYQNSGKELSQEYDAETEAVLNAYKEACKIAGWFRTGTMDCAMNDTVIVDGTEYCRTKNFATKSELEKKMQEVFTDEYINYLFENSGIEYREIDGALYAVLADRGTDQFMGNESYTVSGNSYSGTLWVRVEVLSPEGADVVVGYREFEFPYIIRDGKVLFSDFPEIR